MSTQHTETEIRLAMIRAGYGDGFSLNLPAERLPDYAKADDVAAELARIVEQRTKPAAVLADYDAWRAKRADQSALEDDGKADPDDWAELDERGCDLASELAEVLREAIKPRTVHILVYDGVDDYLVSVHDTHADAEARLVELATERGYDAATTDQTPRDWFHDLDDHAETNITETTI